MFTIWDFWCVKSWKHINISQIPQGDYMQQFSITSSSKSQGCQWSQSFKERTFLCFFLHAAFLDWKQDWKHRSKYERKPTNLQTSTNRNTCFIFKIWKLHYITWLIKMGQVHILSKRCNGIFYVWVVLCIIFRRIVFLKTNAKYMGSNRVFNLTNRSSNENGCLLSFVSIWEMDAKKKGTCFYQIVRLIFHEWFTL